MNKLNEDLVSLCSRVIMSVGSYDRGLQDYYQKELNKLIGPPLGPSDNNDHAPLKPKAPPNELVGRFGGIKNKD